MLQQPFASVLWSSSTALTRENQTSILATKMFWQKQNLQYTLHIYNIKEWHSGVILQHWCAKSGFETQPCCEAPDNLWIK